MSYPVFHVPAGDVLPVFFDTFAGATGASITASGLAVTDIEIYKDGSVTQRSSDAGYTLLDTDGLDFDGLTGVHGFSIDTGDNTDSGFYTVGAWFTVVVSAITVDSQTVSFIAAQFRLMAAEAVAGVPSSNATHISGDSTAADNLETAFDDTAGPVPWLGILDQGTAQSATSTTLVLRAAAAFADDTLIGCIVGAFGSTQGYWQFREITDYVLSTDTATVDAWAVTPSGTITYKVYAGVPAPATPPSVNVIQISGDATAADNAESFFDGTGYAGTNNVIPLVTTTTNLTNKGDGSGFTAIPWNASWDTEVQSEVNDGLVALHLDQLFAATYNPASKPGAADALLNELVESDGGVARFTANALEQAPSGTGASAASIAAALFTVNTGETEASAVAGSVVYEIVQNAGGGTGLDAAGVRAAIGLASANLDTQLGAIDTVVDAVLVDTAEIGVAGAGLTALASAAALATVDDFLDTEIAALTTELAKVPKSDGTATWNTTALASLQAEATDALNAYDPPTRAELTTDTNSVLSAVGDVPTNAELATALAAADDAVLAAIAALNNLSAAQVNAEVVDAINVDTYAEPGQGAPGAALSLVAKVNWMFKAWRNRTTQTATQLTIYADNGTTVDHKATVSDDATTFDRGEIASGP